MKRKVMQLIILWDVGDVTAKDNYFFRREIKRDAKIFREQHRPGSCRLFIMTTDYAAPNPIQLEELFP